MATSFDKSVAMSFAAMAMFAAVAMQIMKVPPLIFTGAAPWLAILALVAIFFALWYLASAIRSSEGCVGDG